MKVFIDTSAFYALAASKDVNHLTAKDKYQELLEKNTTFVLSDHVLAETATLIRRRLSYEASQKFLILLEQAVQIHLYQIVYVDSELLDHAKSVFKKMADPKLSLVDAISFAVMKKWDIRSCFAFDFHFSAAGFEEA